MVQILFGVHIVLCVALVGVVLVQQGKGADLGASLGGGGSNTMFGAAGGADFMTKLTTGLAVAFMLTSILLAKTYGGLTEVSTEQVNPLEGSVLGGATVEAPAEVVDEAVDVATEEAAAVNPAAEAPVEAKTEAAETEEAPKE